MMFMVMLFGDGYEAYGHAVWRWSCCLEMVMLFGDGHAV